MMLRANVSSHKENNGPLLTARSSLPAMQRHKLVVPGLGLSLTSNIAVMSSTLTLGLFRPNVEKSKSSGFSLVSPVFSKKVFSSFRDRNLLPLGPMMKTSYRPAEAPLFLWETFLCQPWGRVSSSYSGVLLESTMFLFLTGTLGGGLLA